MYDPTFKFGPNPLATLDAELDWGLDGDYGDWWDADQGSAWAANPVPVVGDHWWIYSGGDAADPFPPLPGAFGWAGNTTLAQQAQWLGQAAGLSRDSGKVRMTIVFNVDFTVYNDDPQAGYAIIRPGGTCPACDALHQVTGGR